MPLLPRRFRCWRRFTERIGKGLRAAPRDSLIANSIDKTAVGRNFGFQKAMDNSGAIVGPLVAMLVLWLLPDDFRCLFLIAAVPAVLGVVAVVVGVREVGAARRGVCGKVSVRCLPRRFWLFLGVVALFSLGNSSDALLLVKASETGIDSAMIPFVYMIFNVTSVVLAIPSGRLSDRIGRERLIAAGFGVYAVTYLLFGGCSSFGAMVELFVMYGVYSALTDVSQKAFVADLTPAEAKGTAYGVYHATLGLTLLPASLLGGWLYDNVDSRVPFYFGAAMAVLACGLMVVLFAGRRKRQCKSI